MADRKRPLSRLEGYLPNGLFAGLVLIEVLQCPARGAFIQVGPDHFKCRMNSTRIRWPFRTVLASSTHDHEATPYGVVFLCAGNYAICAIVATKITGSLFISQAILQIVQEISEPSISSGNINNAKYERTAGGLSKHAYHT